MILFPKSESFALIQMPPPVDAALKVITLLSTSMLDELAIWMPPPCKAELLLIFPWCQSCNLHLYALLKIHHNREQRPLEHKNHLANRDWSRFVCVDGWHCLQRDTHQSPNQSLYQLRPSSCFLSLLQIPYLSHFDITDGVQEFCH